EGEGRELEASDQDLVSALDDHAGVRRPDDRGAQRQGSRADPCVREHGRPQAWRVRADPHLPGPCRRQEGEALRTIEMQVSAVARYVRLSPQKCRLVADQIRTLPVSRAIELLEFSPKKAAAHIRKVLESAIANAEHNE